ncbi:MAG: catechol 2,3-dioxygenase-like lactoylglutathione lyase family enzyme [Candidatus Poriferisodalaceae bacterium]|jgi:catechol 2,3-dioxygenase-like lactoylglutathione lyase family enzyme
MDATVRFYAGTLGMPLVMTLMAGSMRHYFFEIAPQNTVAFFEIPDAETFTKSSGSPGPHPVQLDHISFNVPDERALCLLQDRIRAAGSEVTEVVDHGVLKSVYFTDPNGIALEASYWVIDATGRPFDPSDEDVFLDPDPVPAVAELAGGGLNSTVKTFLV